MSDSFIDRIKGHAFNFFKKGAALKNIDSFWFQKGGPGICNIKGYGDTYYLFPKVRTGANVYKNTKSRLFIKVVLEGKHCQTIQSNKFGRSFVAPKALNTMRRQTKGAAVDHFFQLTDLVAHMN